MYRCFNDYFGYCKDEPEWDEQPTEEENKRGDKYTIGGSCKLDPKTCGKYQAHSEHTLPAKLPKSSYYHHSVVEKES